jgi:multiple sugar transport system substrate-binding protein
MKRFLALLAASVLVGAAATAAAETVTIEVLHPYAGHKRFHDPIADEFMKQNPDVKIQFRAPAQNYNEGHQGIIRDALTNRLPDVWHSGFHLLPELVQSLSARRQIVELTPLMNGEGEAWMKENYSDNVLSHGVVDGKQWGMPFNASTPIVFYNADLVRRAGGSTDTLPSDWDSVLALARKIGDLGGVDGMAHSVSEWGDDYLWQALVYNYGGTLMNADKTKVTFADDSGKRAVGLLRRTVVETRMPFLTEDQAIQQFAAGKLGLFVASTAMVKGFDSTIGKKFEWVTGPYPLADKAKGGVTTGGNAMVILASDPAKQKAAWRYVKFATGPIGQKIVVLGSGYMPTNLKTVEPAYLGTFYAENPNWTTSMKQWPIARKWFGYPGNKGVKVWQEQRAIIGKIMRGEVEPETGLRQIAEITEKLALEK